MSLALQARIAALEARIEKLEAIVSRATQSEVSEARKGEAHPPETPSISTARETISSSSIVNAVRGALGRR